MDLNEGDPKAKMAAILEEMKRPKTLNEILRNFAMRNCSEE
jgi:hypothetical protein